MRIISINRQFGSGGRELGRRLAMALGFDYYDREVIDQIAVKHGLDPSYVEATLSGGLWRSVPLAVGHSFSHISISTELLSAQTAVLLDIAAQGRDCVIVGRSADTVLREYNPLKIFVYADLESKINRCRCHIKPGEKASDQQLSKMICHIDDERIRTKELISGLRWGDKDNYHLMVNTSGCVVENLVPSLQAFALDWFKSR